MVAGPFRTPLSDWMTTVAVAPDGSVPSAHDTVPMAVPKQLPCVAVTDMREKSWGRAAVRDVNAAASGPVLVTLTVCVTVSSMTADSGEPVTVTARSADRSIMSTGTLAKRTSGW